MTKEDELLMDVATERLELAQSLLKAKDQRIATLEASLRDALHQLETRHGMWVTDRPFAELSSKGDNGWETSRMDIDPAQSLKPGLIADYGTYWRDDTTEACKRIREALERGDTSSQTISTSITAQA